MIDRTAAQVADVEWPERGWIGSVRQALGMSAEQVAKRKGVSRNAVYQAERSELDGGVSIKQMQHLAAAMGGRFVYAIVLDARIEDMLYQQALRKAKRLVLEERDLSSWSPDERQDWIEDKAAELLHNFPADFWEDGTVSEQCRTTETSL
ncbi:helix-turn-helix domain-containing protein [uncultured Roseobacter sp.]|uniref:helix-turn-helix domain-containing protein n=1 Tax=uncultured Roseobacter sp. TaxID=114847 RepID=UPI00262EA69D|nr:helix-turn-helix domain-containing protein [uncultured Roseobacter sp.]